MLGIEFGEKLLYKVKPQIKNEKINSRWEYGIFIGVSRRSGEPWIVVEDSVFAVRIPVEEMRSEDLTRLGTVTKEKSMQMENTEQPDEVSAKKIEPSASVNS